MISRVEQHPILGCGEEKNYVVINVDGVDLKVVDGEPIAAALLANGIKVFRYTAKYHEPRGLFCGIGQCTDCVMEVDGIPNVKTCVTPVKAGMQIRTQHGNGKWVPRSGKI